MRTVALRCLLLGNDYSALYVTTLFIEIENALLPILSLFLSSLSSLRCLHSPSNECIGNLTNGTILFITISLDNASFELECRESLIQQNTMLGFESTISPRTLVIQLCINPSFSPLSTSRNDPQASRELIHDISPLMLHDTTEIDSFMTNMRCILRNIISALSDDIAVDSTQLTIALSVM